MPTGSSPIAEFELIIMTLTANDISESAVFNLSGKLVPENFRGVSL
jgi:hypothetical protein